jgi:beta-galactosidase beta subunit
MNKTQRRKEVTKRFLTFVEEKFPNYELDDDGFGGYISIVNSDYNGLNDNVITYHRSYFDVFVLDSASEQVKQDADEMQSKLDEILKELELN